MGLKGFVLMKNFLKKNSDMIIKLIVHQFGLTVFGFLLYSAASVSGNRALVIGFSIFSVAFYLFLVYNLAWENGSKDKIRIDAGRLERDNFKGLKADLIAQIPNLIIAFVSLIAYICINRAIVSEAGQFVTPVWAVNTHAICQLIGFYINAMYLGIFDYFDLVTLPFSLLLLTVPTLLTCALGYYFGTKEKYGILTTPPKKR